MKKENKYSFWYFLLFGFLLCIFGLGYFAYTTYAATDPLTATYLYRTQSAGGYSTTFDSGSTQGDCTGAGTGQWFTPTSTAYASEIWLGNYPSTNEFFGGGLNTNSAAYVHLWLCDDATLTKIGETDSVTRTDTGTSGTYDYYHWTLTSPVQLTANAHYFFAFRYDSGNFLSFTRNLDGVSQFGTNLPRFMGAVSEGNPTASVSMYFPNTTSTITDFSTWYITNSNMNFGNKIVVQYWNTDGYASTIFEDEQQYTSLNALDPFPVTKKYPLTWSIVPGDTHWMLRTGIKSSVGAMIYWSSTSTITINNTTGQASSTNPIPSWIPQSFNASSSTSTQTYSGSIFADLNSSSSPFFVDCSQGGAGVLQIIEGNILSSPLGFIDVPTIVYNWLGGSNASSTIAQDSLVYCYAKKYTYGLIGLLFVPGQGALNIFNNAYQNFKTTFPFSGFFQYTGAIETGIADSASSTTNYDLKITLPPFNEITLLTSSTLADSFGTSTKAQIFTIQDTVLWIGTGMTIIAMFLL